MTNRVSKQTGPTNLDEYDVRQRAQLLHQIIEGRLKAERTEFVDRQQIYDLAANSIAEAKDANTRAEFELLKLLALANWAESLPNNLKDKSPYREWHRTHDPETIENGFGGGYNLRTELLWNLETRYHALPIAIRSSPKSRRRMLQSSGPL